MTPVNDGGVYILSGSKWPKSNYFGGRERAHARTFLPSFPMFLLEFLEEGREPASPPQLYLNLNLTIRRSVSQRESELGRERGKERRDRSFARSPTALPFY